MEGEILQAGWSKAKRWVVGFLGLAFIGAAFPAGGMALLSVMASDSGVDSFVILFISAFWALPVLLVIAGLTLMVVAFRRKGLSRVDIFLVSLPFINIAVIALFFLL